NIPPATSGALLIATVTTTFNLGQSRVRLHTFLRRAGVFHPAPHHLALRGTFGYHRCQREWHYTQSDQLQRFRSNNGEVPSLLVEQKLCNGLKSRVQPN